MPNHNTRFMGGNEASKHSGTQTNIGSNLAKEVDEYQALNSKGFKSSFSKINQAVNKHASSKQNTPKGAREMIETEPKHVNSAPLTEVTIGDENLADSQHRGEAVQGHES